MKIVYNFSDKKLKDLLDFFNYLEIKIESIKKTSNLKYSNILQILKISENGFADILKSNKLNEIKNMKFNEAMKFILNNKNLLKNNLFFDEKILVNNANKNNLRVFMSKKRRQEFITGRRKDIF